jgi:hypothetical protein
VIRAATHDGLLLPVIDVTDPRFAIPDDADALRRLFEQLSAEAQRNRHLPKFVMHWLMRRAAKHSRLLRAMFAGDASFLDGTTTYLMKLGPDNLPPPYDSTMDRRVAGSPHLTLLRLRTQQVARLIADALAAELASRSSAPLSLINIAGGPAIDSMNALILLRRRDGDLLRRAIAIHVLDQDEAGPAFGQNALAALLQEGGPLAGLDIAFHHHRYDWNEAAPLERLLGGLSASAGIVAALSEGGLFEYGNDAAVIANLQALRGGQATLVAGSVTNDEESRRRMMTMTRFKLIPRGIEGFAPLAKAGGWRIARAETARISEQVLLAPA